MAHPEKEELLPYEREHLSMLRGLAPECTVLLRSDGSFPLSAPCRLALYGNGARHTVMGGTGSGEVNTRYFVTAEEGLTEAGFTIATQAWLDGYDAALKQARADFIKEVRERARKKHTLALLEGMGAVMPEPEYELPLEAEAEAAVYVLARNSGEGMDRQAVPGDILLTESEKRDILALQRRFPKFLLVLNVGGPVDLSPLSEVKNILLLSQLGIDTGNILADLLLGKAYPSGKLSTTWSAWEDAPHIGEFGEKDDTHYYEGIYVGYRYFDSIGKRALFPFGFGLSYTGFEAVFEKAWTEGETVFVQAHVRNAGKVSGKETLQLYVSVPGKKLDAPYQTLAAFAKTAELATGEEERLILSFALSDLASYDAARACYVLEAGRYLLRLGTDSVQTKVCAVLELDGEAITARVKNVFGESGFTDWKPEKSVENREAEDAPLLPVKAADIPCRRPRERSAGTVNPGVKKLKNEELAYLNIGAFSGHLGALSMIGNAGKTVAGAAGETTDRLKKKGLPSLVMADGPAGLRLARDYTVDKDGAHGNGEAMLQSLTDFMPAWQQKLAARLQKQPKKGAEILHQYATALPIGTALAQSWNPVLAEACGDIVGDEMERFGVHLWLAPALNIHRDIRCGRNFEYFSEDPLLSGLFAAALTRGVQKHPGCGVTIKHFAANNQETNRYNNSSRVSERALREIYLRGFEICVRKAQPCALMTSYNLINGIHTSEHRGLIAEVLRGEFGFSGIVMTDWVIARAVLSRGAKYAPPRASRVAAAGGDLAMPGETADYQDILSALKDGSLSRGQLEENATRVVRMIRRLTGAKQAP